MIRPTAKPKAQRNGLNKIGPRTKSWSQVWRWLKPRMEKAGRVGCEFGFIPHECWGPLDPVHAHKRRKAEGERLYYVARGCRRVHDELDLHRTHEEMEQAVMRAIKEHGGLILP